MDITSHQGRDGRHGARKTDWDKSFLGKNIDNYSTDTIGYTNSNKNKNFQKV